MLTGRHRARGEMVPGRAPGACRRAPVVALVVSALVLIAPALAVGQAPAPAAASQPASKVTRGPSAGTAAADASGNVSGAPDQARARDAAATVEKFHTALLAIMRDAKNLGYQGRYATIAPTVERSFALPAMARIVAGAEWQRLDDSARRRLVEAFSRMTIATYAARFDGFSGESFRTLGADAAPRGSTLIRTELVKSDGSTVPLNYVLRPVENDWRVYDIYLDGAYSELATKRSEYTSVLKDGGIDTLVTRIDRKIADLENAHP